MDKVYTVYLNRNGNTFTSLEVLDAEVPCIDYLHFLVGAGEEPIGEMFCVDGDVYIWNEDGKYEMIGGEIDG